MQIYTATICVIAGFISQNCADSDEWLSRMKFPTVAKYCYPKTRVVLRSGKVEEYEGLIVTKENKAFNLTDA